MADQTLMGIVALVTGASSGIGEATARALAARGAKVALIARRRDRLETLVTQIAESGGEALALVCDVADEAQVSGAVQAMQDKWGRLDVLVNCAGFSAVGPVLGADTEEWRQAVGVNLMGLMYMTHAALPMMQAQGTGHIINISSTSARTIRQWSAVYSATKAAVNAFSEALRQECVPYSVRVTTIEPGQVRTELVSHITHAPTREALEARAASIHLLDAEDLAAAVVYILTQPAHVSINEMVIRPSEQA